jgi:hypothetical protein
VESDRLLGSQLENAVFNVLNQRCESLSYMKERYEIDFRCANTLYQVSYDIEDQKTRKRELDAFAHFDGENSLEHRLVTYDTDETAEEATIEKYETFALRLPEEELEK